MINGRLFEIPILIREILEKLDLGFLILIGIEIVVLIFILNNPR